jgi:hypothetical protein
MLVFTEDFECGDMVEFHTELVCRLNAPHRAFRVDEIHYLTETGEILFVRLKPNVVFNGKRVENIHPKLLKKIDPEE